ncbi:MAG: type II secretion system F family protein, partial [Terriglobia bacterium]
MPVYSYSGTTAAGAPVTGERSADNRRALEAMLRRERIQWVKITEKGKEFALPTFGGGVSAKELAVFTRQFSVMIDAGLPLVQCLEILAGQQENRAFQKALTGVRSSVEGGSTLANALRQHPKVFDDLYVNMVEAGETGGILDNILQRLSSYIEKNVKLKSAVTSAMIYPISVISIMVAVVTLLLWKVVPTFITLFAGLGAELPLPTKIVMSLSNIVSYVLGGIWYITFPLIIAAVFGAKALIATPKGRYAFDAALLKTPLVGMVLRRIAVARFTRTLGTLIASGVPILEGLTITAR